MYMLRWIKLIAICAVSSLCILLVMTTYSRTKANSSLTNEKFTKNISIDHLIELQREIIIEEMENFEYPSGRYGVDAKKLDDLTPETGGIPVRSIIITNWRSGSTFLGDIINAVPGTYYHFEPLLPFGVIKIRGPPNDKKAIEIIKKLLNCDYSDMDDYLELRKEKKIVFNRNHHLWSRCKQYPRLCGNPKFLTSFCKLFPLQNMKLVRLRLALAEQLLDDASLNVRILLLIRDPRGMIQCRKRFEWCIDSIDCLNKTFVCNDLVNDYYDAVLLMEKYPSRFRVLRYEDLSRNPYEITRDILQFYGLPFDPKVEEFLDTHTKEDIINDGGLSTSRDSKTTPFLWMNKLQWFEIEDIEEKCEKGMELWGYRKMNSTKVPNETFDSVLPAPFI